MNIYAIPEILSMLFIFGCFDWSLLGYMKFLGLLAVILLGISTYFEGYTSKRKFSYSWKLPDIEKIVMWVLAITRG